MKNFLTKNLQTHFNNNFIFVKYVTKYFLRNLINTGRQEKQGSIPGHAST